MFRSGLKIGFVASSEVFKKILKIWILILVFILLNHKLSSFNLFTAFFNQIAVNSALWLHGIGCIINQLYAHAVKGFLIFSITFHFMKKSFTSLFLHRIYFSNVGLIRREAKSTIKFRRWYLSHQKILMQKIPSTWN